MSTRSRQKLVNFTMGGKGGVGKTGLVVALAEWFMDNQVPSTLLDLDTENKAKGSLCHYFGSAAQKVNIYTSAGLDAFVDYLDKGAPVILADMGAGAGRVTYDWFDTMYDVVSQLGIGFTAIGVVTDDPASVESVLAWATRLQDRVDYLIVENAHGERDGLRYWRESEQGTRFREVFQPGIIRMGHRIPELENACRNYGVTLGKVAKRQTDVPELHKTSLVLRAQSYRSQLYAEFEKCGKLLVPVRQAEAVGF